MNTIKGNNIVDINDIIAMETKVVSLPIASKTSISTDIKIAA